MEIYIKLFEVLFPVFFVVGVGYYIGKKDPKIDTKFITNLAANFGTPALILYALNIKNISFDIFFNYFWYFLLAIIGFFIVGLIILYILKTKDIVFLRWMLRLVETLEIFGYLVELVILIEYQRP